MINANELRIGNRILWNPKLSHPGTTLPPTEVEVSFVSADRIGYLSPSIEHRVEPFEDDLLQLETPYGPLEEFEPVPLTPELLNKIKNAPIFITDLFPISFSTEGVFLDQISGGRQKLEHIKYLHHLQNLFFAFTEKELELG
ncbi:hypothetical protein [Flavisolibacter ginsenosidimutans]|uniref:Uncharacterized protein n=1 Tax=Flavisolibacter ginsenosidimutans TaxID=661481 RepID=A0A5B8UH26_9BACT|nr:hypothetical protein [Flavisolibacter ginsenosidimutans]QEC55813.1 hypothetical protein FSB75_07870 [Flavisolibacter ginsenosidimutans]